MVLLGVRNRLFWGGLLIGFVLAGCSSRINRAPVEDRGVDQGRTVPVTTDFKAKTGAVAPSPDRAARLEHYTVKSGDTLIRIGLDTGQNWRDIARWNNIDNPNQIEVGQSLRVQPPSANSASSSVAVSKPVSSSNVRSSPVPEPGASATNSPSLTATPEDEINWSWPTRSTSVLAGFHEVKNKGLDIAGVAGDPILAAADGRVVYAGSGLRGYGNLIILKHNNTYLTAYAHNQTLLIKEDQLVQKGQQIAEMGNSDADRVKLHFELRRQGKPVDPAQYLPIR